MATSYETFARGYQSNVDVRVPVSDKLENNSSSFNVRLHRIQSAIGEAKRSKSEYESPSAVVTRFRNVN